MAETNPLEAFRLALGGAARAIAREPEVELGYSADAPVQSGKTVKVPMPGRTLPADQVAEARGAADAFALRLRLHDAVLHNRVAPADPVARAVFDAVEQARVEALGSKGMDGISANLATALEARMRADPIGRARTREEVPLSTAIGLMVRERLTGQPVPERAKGGLALVQDWIEEKAGADLNALSLALDDQTAFAQLATRLLQDLELVEAELPPNGSPRRATRRRKARTTSSRARPTRNAKAMAPARRTRPKPAPRPIRANPISRTKARPSAIHSPTRKAASATMVRKVRRRRGPTVRSPICRRSSTTRPTPRASTR